MQAPRSFSTYVLNKPRGVVSQRNDALGRDSVAHQQSESVWDGSSGLLNACAGGACSQTPKQKGRNETHRAQRAQVYEVFSRLAAEGCSSWTRPASMPCLLAVAECRRPHCRPATTFACWRRRAAGGLLQRARVACCFGEAARRTVMGFCWICEVAVSPMRTRILLASWS